MKIGILGSGLMGGTLGTIFARTGHEVVFSYARTRRKLDELARSAGGKASAGSPAQAVDGADVVLLAVHWTRVDDVLAQAGAQAGALAGKTLMTCSLPMNADDTELVLGLSTSGAEALAAKLPQVHVASAFCTAPSEVLFPVFERRSQKKRPDMVHCGDDDDAKLLAVQLIRDAGFNPLDLGELQMARHVEPFALLVGQLAYRRAAGPEIAYHFEHLS